MSKTAKFQMFQYTVILNLKDENGNYTGAEVLVEPKYVMARSEKEVAFKATREIPAEKCNNPEEVDIVIQNF